MNYFDIFFVVTIAIFVIHSTLKGAVQDFCSLFLLFFSFYIAVTLGHYLQTQYGAMLENQVVFLKNKSFSKWIFHVLSFSIVYFVGNFVTRQLVSVIRTAGLSIVDRFLGGGLGFVKGVLVSSFLLFLADLLPIEKVWVEYLKIRSNSVGVPYLEKIIDLVRGYILKYK